VPQRKFALGIAGGIAWVWLRQARILNVEKLISRRQ
jgi:hypothetical protein